MNYVALFISIIALIVAYIAYQRSGGSLDEMKNKIEELGITTEGLRAKTADLLNTIEKKLRGEDKPSNGSSSEPPQS